MSVALIGNFMYQHPSDDAIGSFDLLLTYFLLKHYVTADFKLYAMCEARRTLSPGILLYQRLNDICQSPELNISYPIICQHLVTEAILSLVVSFTDFIVSLLTA